MMTLTEIAKELGLTCLQVGTLKVIGEEIKSGRRAYRSYSDNLSVLEDVYLRLWLCNEGIAIKEYGAE